MNYEKRVKQLESEGLTTSDAQAVADAVDEANFFAEVWKNYKDEVIVILRRHGMTQDKAIRATENLIESECESDSAGQTANRIIKGE
jgi:hypothetical protein